MASPSYPVSSLRTLFFLISNCSPVLFLQLPSTPSFYTVHDQVVRLPGSTFLLSFISDAPVFPNPSLLRDCSFDLFCPSAGGSHQAPGFPLNILVSAAVNVVVLWGLLGPLAMGRPHNLYQISSQQGNRLSLCGLRTHGLHSLLLGIRPSHQSTTRY